MTNETTVPLPGSFVAAELKQRDWTQRDLAGIMGRPFQLINEIIKGKRSITTETAIALAAAFGNDPELWIQREAAYQVFQSKIDASDVYHRAHLYEVAPIKEMERRGWIHETSNALELENELKRFFSVSSLETEPMIKAVTRKSDSGDPLSAGQRAWCFRVKQRAESIAVPAYRPEALPSCKKELRKIAAYPQEAHKVSLVLAKYGIRFVVVEPLPGIKVDGVAIWLDQESPVIGMSLRYDRIDSFWFTLCHELSHIENKDEAPLDVDLTDKMDGITVVRDQIERRANDDAADMLIPHAEMQSFVRRIGPLYSKKSIIGFANRIKMHPGIVVGQLQRRHEIGYHANREMLSKIREFVISTSVPDGWGYTPD